MQRKITSIYIFILVCSAIFLGYIFIHDFKTPWNDIASVDGIHIWDSYAVTGDDNNLVVSGQLCEYSNTHAVIAFYTTHLDFEVYADSNLLYQFPEKKNNPFSNTSGYAWHFIELPADICELELKLTTPYGSIHSKTPTFYVGNTPTILSLIIQENLPVFILCVMLFGLGLIMITYWTIVHERVAISPSICYLGLSAALLSLWTMSQNRFTTLVMNNNLLTVYASFHLFMLLPLPIVLFVQSYYEDEKSKVWKFLYYIILAQNIICITLHYLRIVDFVQTLWTSFAVIGISVVSVLVYSFHLYRRSYNKQKIIFHMVSLLLFFILSGIDMLVYTFAGWSNSILGRLGIIGYIVILGYDTVKESAKLMKMGEQAAAYHQLAFSDNMTGLANRTAYNHDFSQHSIEPNGIAIIDFDLNCLKLVNDQHGHQAGDRYIMLAANLIEKHFTPLGKIYRIGGDEFVVIVSDCEDICFEPFFEALNNDITKYNQRSNQFKIQIAYGMAIYSSSMDRSLEDTYIRADKAMYQTKKRQKGL